MKTSFLFISLLLLFDCSSKAQTTQTPATGSENPTTGFIALNYGTAKPLGNYASTSNSSSSGYAISGSDLSISAGVPINHSHFGVAFKFDHFTNGYDEQSLNSNQTANNPGYIWNVSADSYSGQTVLIGLYGTLALHHFAFDYRFMGGIMFANYPEISYSALDNNADTMSNTNQSSASSSSFAFDIGIGLRWNVSNHFCLRIDYDYLASSQSFTVNTEQTNTYSGTSISQPVMYKQQYTMANVTFGIGYVFDRE